MKYVERNGRDMQEDVVVKEVLDGDSVETCFKRRSASEIKVG
jgi:hypothetical protein